MTAPSRRKMTHVGTDNKPSAFDKIFPPTTTASITPSVSRRVPSVGPCYRLYCGRRQDTFRGTTSPDRSTWPHSRGRAGAANAQASSRRRAIRDRKVREGSSTGCIASKRLEGEGISSTVASPSHTGRSQCAAMALSPKLTPRLSRPNPAMGLMDPGMEPSDPCILALL